MTAVERAVSGVLPIYKPAGMTSKDVSRILQRRFGKLKIGHVGTLDPDADGVLPILLGSGTKLQDYLLDIPKSYSFTVKLGTATDTLDASGTTVETAPYDHVAHQHVLEVLPRFLGPIEQIPPLYSAVKLNGKELYKHARAGRSPVEDLLQKAQGLARKVTIYNLECVEMRASDLDFHVRCSKGTYVRTLAVDICRALSTVGHVTRLTRTSSAGFALDECLQIEGITGPDTELANHVVSADKISIGLPIWQCDDRVTLQRIKVGQRVEISFQKLRDSLMSCPPKVHSPPSLFLLRDEDGTNIGIVEWQSKINSDLKIIHMKRGLR